MIFIEKTREICYIGFMKKSQKMLLVSCCAPCSAGVIKTLAESGKKFDVLFYNPNIRPLAEYERRRDENKRVCDLFGVSFIELPYETCAWDTATHGLENEPERGRRCDICFELRLTRAALYAKEKGYTCFSSVLGISRHKDFEQVCRAGKRAEAAVGIPYDTTNWRKNGGENVRAALEKELNLYRQNYCGCKPRQ